MEFVRQFANQFVCCQLSRLSLCGLELSLVTASREERRQADTDKNSLTDSQTLLKETSNTDV